MLHGVDASFVTAVNRAWAWLHQQSAFFAVKAKTKLYTGKPEELKDMIKTIQKYNNLLKMDLLSPEVQNNYLYDSITLQPNSVVRAALLMRNDWVRAENKKKEEAEKQANAEADAKKLEEEALAKAIKDAAAGEEAEEEIAPSEPEDIPVDTEVSEDIVKPDPIGKEEDDKVTVDE